MAETSHGGVLARTLAAVKYAFTGNTPADWFGPNKPLIPQAPPEVAGRQWDYPVAINLNTRPRSEEPVGFDRLKALANGSDLLRIVIEGQKDKLEALDWTLKPRAGQGGKRGSLDQGGLAIQAQLQTPDGSRDWSQWLRMLLEQHYVLDAVSIYRRRTIGGDPYSFELLDGATIKVLLDAGGRRPMMPSPAYQQVLKGLPAVDYTSDELLYYPQNVRADHAYGFSRVEQIILTVDTAIERMKSQLAFFKFGNLSDGFFSMPPGMTADEIRKLETMWNNMMLPGVENRRTAPFLPAGATWNGIGQPPLQDAFDEWLIRIICFCFSTSATPFMKQAGLGHGSAVSEHDAAEAAGLGNTMGFVRRLMNRLIAEDFKRPDLEFDWIEDREFDPDVKSQIEDRRLKNGSLTLDDVRDRNGEPPLADGLGSKPLIYTAQGAVLLADIVDPPEPEPIVVPPIPANDPAQPGADGVPAPLAKAAPAAAERKLAAVLARFLKARSNELADALGSKLGMAKTDSSMDDHGHSFDSAYDAVDWDWAPLVRQVQPILTGVAVAAGKDATADLGLFDKDTLAAMTKAATDYAEGRAAEMVGRKLVDGELVENDGWSITSATRDMVRSEVVKAMDAGASNDELAAAIRSSEAFSKARAEMIARTETAKADTEGAIAGWKATGLVAGKQWLASPDCCDDCQGLDGQIVALDDDFDGGDHPLHPGCRCAVTAVLPEDMPDAGTDD